MSDKKPLLIPDSGMLSAPRTRRDILKLMAVGGSVVFLPTMMAACSDNSSTGIKNPPQTGPGTGAALTIDFAKGDIAVLQFAYALEQLEADFYTKVVAAFGNLTSVEKTLLQDVKYHEVIHREYFKAALGTANGFTITTTYPNINFSDRLSVLNTAAALEETGVTAYNGAAQYIADPNYLLAAGKIVSVEARHASAINDLLNPNTASFAPRTFDNVAKPSTVAGIAQGFVVDKLTFANYPTSFVQGPNNNG
jgi:rubrerythrin